ncbi:MAG: MBL fold metallo-hydrolase, partial [Paracoccus sp. (in: a-proteobacteria)]
MRATVKDLTRVLAPNPSVLTGPGTNTFVLGTRDRVVIDPGPDDDTHLAAILAAAAGRVSHILVTHAHRDHSAGAARLAQMTAAPVLAFGDAMAGRSALMRNLAAQGLVAGGEGLDHGFSPDITLRDHETVATPAGEVMALHTPGHSGGHLCFGWQGMLFSGDIVMGWTSTLISPP